jgi:hypothetical protein
MRVTGVRDTASTVRTFLVSIIVLAACHETPAKRPARPSASRAAPAQPGVDDPLALLPSSSDVVITVDVAALRESSLWSKYQQHVVDFIAPSFAGCGYNPLADLVTMTAGIPMGDELAVFVFRGLDRDRTLHCLKASKLETNTTAMFDGDMVKLVNKSGRINLITFLDAKTMVMQGSTNPTRETLATALKMGAPLRQNRGYLALEEKLSAGAAVAFVIPPASKALDKMSREKLGAPARDMYATVHVTDFVAVHGTVTMQNAADAAAIAEASQSKLAAMKPYVQRYDVHVEGDKVLFDLEITEAQIRIFADMAKAMMPAGR